MPDTSRDEFLTQLRRAGLDPAVQDTDAMYEAWIKLHDHMHRLRDPQRPADRQPLSTFNPDRLTMNRASDSDDV